MIPHPMGILYPWNPFLVTECRWTISGIVTPVIVQVFVSTTSGLASVNHLGSHLQLVAGQPTWLNSLRTLRPLRIVVSCISHLKVTRLLPGYLYLFEIESIVFRFYGLFRTPLPTPFPDVTIVVYAKHGKHTLAVIK